MDIEKVVGITGDDLKQICDAYHEIKSNEEIQTLRAKVASADVSVEALNCFKHWWNGLPEVCHEKYDQSDSMTAFYAGMHFNQNLVLQQPAGVVDELVKALRDMTLMHNLMMKQINHGASFYQADCLQLMNEAPIKATEALATYDKLSEVKHATK